MKLGSLKEGGRDGTLVVVSRDLKHAVKAAGIAATLQAALDDWANVAPRLNALSADLDAGQAAGAFALDMTALASPLPRAYEFVDGSAYLPHVERVRKARGAEVPASFYTDPLMYQATSAGFLGPRDPVVVPSEDYGIDLEAEVVVVTDDVPMAATPAEAAEHTWLNDQWFGAAECGVDMQFSFAELVAHAAKTRPLTAGTIVGSGTIANEDTGKGASCLAEQRTVETLRDGKPGTPFLKYGDTLRIEVTDAHGASIFGAIEQRIAPLVR